MNRKQLISQVHDLIETYCAGCFVNSHFRKEHGKSYAQSFCIKQCTVGEKLKEYGKKLS
ncbi:zinc-finger domain-containing protein [Ectobacillus panaciterrae]|uniref:zinc-finger domain-containing protein n=1 Tax=Ectobacillus panaciterrae TaxID=363872 RepID=UPI00040633BB|nr:zinc-finger domain-containing protein [Ectobacillus panaciterrae]